MQGSDIMANTVSATATRTAPARYDGFDNMLLDGEWRQGRSDQFGDDFDPYTSVRARSVSVLSASNSNH